MLLLLSLGVMILGEMLRRLLLLLQTVTVMRAMMVKLRLLHQLKQARLGESGGLRRLGVK
jgi:hypothetical protein